MEAGVRELVLAGACAVAVLVGVAALVLAARARSGARREVAAARAESADLAARLEALEQERAAAPSPAPVPAQASAAVVHPVALGASDGRPVEVAATLPAPVFTDMVVRESVIRLASLTHGVRRALAPEQRHRVRLEVRREVKRSRKQRRAATKAALRDQQARERAAAEPRGPRDVGEDAA